eukprot:CAMPEP_0184368340 /NCGR_PEP_ID=MMETSP1089-20130417/161594_1 /TAXON_ID=38269 ORGANISM="Gloeochaete wittrockiana, Strain SAG46.84" /NCGR_SAMPLE_ID=MMETSP1089 /ASSEMBLY_ACC=CAM_ASM_000445 /LENGTH=1030 /DNA_ID=CAMNT_0026710583 /DNA_START=60 /DNA_END=3153 /DNA_ORIENTATION=+
MSFGAVFVVFLAACVMLCQEANAGCSVTNLKFTGGDGFLPVLGNDNKIYNTYHHQAARVQCVDPATGDFCTGYPSDGILLTPLLQALDWPGMTGIPGIALADTLVQSNYNGVMFRCQDPLRDECAHYLNPITFIMADTRIFFGVSCFDTKNNRLCTGSEVTILNPASVYFHNTAVGPVIPNGGIQSFVPYNDKAYSFDYGMNLLCYDLVTSQRCPGFPKSYASILPAVNPALGSGESLVTLRYLNYNGRPSLYVAVAGGGIPGSPTSAVRFTCFELSSGAFNICPEFFGQAYDLVPSGAGYVFEFFFDYDKSGNPTAICLFSYAVAADNAACRSLSNPNVAPASSNLDAIKAHSSNYGMINQLTIDNRMYWGTVSLHNMFCFDFNLGTVCPNFPISEFDRTGKITNDYGVAKDPNGNCFFALGDAANLYSFDAEGHLPCVANVVQPNAVDDSYYFTNYNTVTLDVLGNDSEFNPPSFAITITSASPNIAIVNGKIQFTPTQPIDTFTYRICSVGFGPSSDTAVVVVKACLDENDSDGDGVFNCFDLDDDNDGILDTVEGTGNPDGDVFINSFDLDSDGDGIFDLIENIANGPALPNTLNLVTSSGYSLDLNNDGRLDGTGASYQAISTDVGKNGVVNRVETSIDSGILISQLSHPNTDGTGNADFLDTDSDDDTILDSTEKNVDSDGDKIPDFRDLDSNNDGIPDNTPLDDVGKNGVVNRVETSIDSGILISQLSHPNTDSDSSPDFLDTDSDGDTVLDSAEGNNDNDGDNIPNFRELDSDNDGILDSIEKNIDSDSDGVPNFLDLDSDNDGTSDLVESGSYNPQDRDHFTGVDSDKDGIVNEVDQAPSAFRGPANFVVLDTDRDGTPDYLEVDSDNDGTFDADEKSNLPPSFINSSTGRVVGSDSDGDGIVNIIDDCNCFGGLTARKFTIISPTNAPWLMYASKEISWQNSLDTEYTALKIDLVNAKTGARKVIHDTYPIGPDSAETQSVLYRMSGVALGAYKISFGVYTTSGSFVPDRFSSPLFNVKT